MDTISDSPEGPVDGETVAIPAPKPARTTLGPYRLIEKIGAGGMGEIYLAEDARLNRRVALKLLPARFTEDADRVRRFVQEAQAASALNHPNIITIFEIGQAEGAHYMVTEFIQGQTLRTQTGSSLPISRALEVAIQMAGALKAAHDAGIVHRDIKPENVMIRPDGLVKLLDFGIAKLTERSSIITPPTPVVNARTVVLDDLYATKLETEVASPAQISNETAPGIIMGTVTYMPPEQLRGVKVDARADIFSLGVVLYEVIAGRSPFAGTTQVDIISAILNTEPAPLATYRPETPPELQRIITRTLQKDRDARYQRVDDLLADLTELKQELDFQAKLRQSSGSSQIDSNGVDFSTKPLEPVNTGEARSPSRTGIISGELNRHKRGVMATLAIVILATGALAYLVYGRHPGGAGTGINSIAVLPFRNMSNDPEKEYLSDGISESLINRLSQLPGLKVIANSSSSRYKGTEKDPREVARALDTAGVLTGRLQQVGDRLSISVELVDGRDSTQVWGERYDRNATDLLSLETEISSEIAERLRLKLTSGQKRHLAAPAKENPEAYELLLKGRYHRSRGGMEDRKKAADYFNQAIAVDHNLAAAYAELSDIYRSLVGSGVLSPKQYLLEAEKAAQKAIALDDSLADAHYALANLKTYDWQWEDAEREYRRAVELNPNLALAHRWYASYLRLMGRHEHAIAEIKLARDLDPLSPAVNATVGYILMNARRYDEAVDVLNKTLELDRNYPYTHLFLGLTYSAKGMYPEAIAAYQHAIKLGLDTPSTQISFGAAYAQAGERRQAEAILKQLQTSKEYVSPGELAALYTALGERELAFALLEKAYEEHDSQLQYLGVSPAFDGLRADPRFQDLLRRIGITD
jgi:eukaryotic-like serine/threonine-protein kinase